MPQSIKNKPNSCLVILALFFSYLMISTSSFAAMASISDDEGGACDTQQFAQMPCRCCKMDCWYSIARSATHQLGHMPGQQGEEEALATLRLIRACMITECSPICKPAVGLMKKRRLSAPQKWETE